jgi:hypothetical protein
MDPTPTPPTNPANPVPTPIISPTGKALVNLPPWLTILCAALVPACGTVAAAADLPKGFTIACVAIGASAAALLGLSAGLRDKSAVMLAVIAAALLAAPAQAEGLTVGPSLPMLAVTPGDTHPVSLAPGAGISVGGDLFPTTLVGRPVHWLTLGGDLFGSILASSAAYNLSVAVHAAVLELFTVGVGLKLLDSGGHGALEHFDGRTVFVLLGLDYGLLNAFIYGHAGEPEGGCDGDHPCGSGT